MYFNPGALVGKRIEIPVHYDLWMRGARYGEVVGYTVRGSGCPGYVVVRMDNPHVRRLVRVYLSDLTYTKVVGGGVSKTI